MSRAASGRLFAFCWSCAGAMRRPARCAKDTSCGPKADFNCRTLAGNAAFALKWPLGCVLPVVPYLLVAFV